jgi:hypothetical protein
MHYQTQTTKYHTIYVGDPYVQELLKCITIEYHNYIHKPLMSQPHFWKSVRMTFRSKMGTWKSFGTLETSEFNYRGQNTSPWDFFYIIRKLSKCRCRKWLCMSHLNIYKISYGKKKNQESNWQFDSWPLKVGNWSDPGVCRWSVTHRWKALKDSYKFFSDLIPIKGLSKELWARKVPGVKTGTVSGLLLGSPGTKSHSNVGATEKHKEFYMGEGGGFPQV